MNQAPDYAKLLDVGIALLRENPRDAARWVAVALIAWEAGREDTFRAAYREARLLNAGEEAMRQLEPCVSKYCAQVLDKAKISNKEGGSEAAANELLKEFSASPEAIVQVTRFFHERDPQLDLASIVAKAHEHAKDTAWDSTIVLEKEEARYLSRYPDVAKAIAEGAFRSGWEHYVLCGHAEGRSYLLESK